MICSPVDHRIGWPGQHDANLLTLQRKPSITVPTALPASQFEQTSVTAPDAVGLLRHVVNHNEVVLGEVTTTSSKSASQV